jgi:hypothetical protein
MISPTLAGQQVREQIRGLGVDLAGLTANDAGGVLASVVARLRQTQDGLGKYQTESGILGITDPGTLYGLNTPGYITTAQRRDLGYQQAARRQISQTTQLVSTGERQLGLDNSEYDDLNGQYNVDRNIFSRQSNVFSGLSAAQASQLAAAVGLPSDDTFSSQDSRLAVLRYLAANPNSDLANSARRPLASLDRSFDQSYLGGAYRHLTDGTYSSNESDIQYQFDQDAARSPFGRAGAFFSAQGREIANAFNLYTPEQSTGDNRPQDADTTIRQDNAAGDRLSNYGDRTLSNYQAIGGSIRTLQDPAALADYTRLYGTQEGQARYYNTLAGLKRSQATSLVTGGEQIQDAQQQGYVLGQPRNREARHYRRRQCVL